MAIFEWIDFERYRSRLYTQRIGPNHNADLTFNVRVFLQKIDPPGGHETGTVPDYGDNDVTIVPWGTLWGAWRQKFKRVVEDGYNNKAWLVPSTGWWPQEDGARQYIVHHVRCRLNIILVESAGAAHLTVRCVRIERGEFHQSYMDGPNARPPFNGQLDHLDVLPRDNVPCHGGTFTQTPAVHEMGHFLQLSHVNAFGQGNAYGSSEWQCNDVMGAGGRLEAWHFRPWRVAIHRHVRVFPAVSWTVSMTRPRPLVAVGQTHPSRSSTPGRPVADRRTTPGR